MGGSVREAACTTHPRSRRLTSASCGASGRITGADLTGDGMRTTVDKGPWIFGMVCVEMEVSLFKVEVRPAAMLGTKTAANVMRETTIHSDMWAAYNWNFDQARQEVRITLYIATYTAANTTCAWGMPSTIWRLLTDSAEMHASSSF